MAHIIKQEPINNEDVEVFLNNTNNSNWRPYFTAEPPPPQVVDINNTSRSASDDDYEDEDDNNYTHNYNRDRNHIKNVIRDRNRDRDDNCPQTFGPSSYNFTNKSANLFAETCVKFMNRGFDLDILVNQYDVFRKFVRKCNMDRSDSMGNFRKAAVIILHTLSTDIDKPILQTINPTELFARTQELYNGIFELTRDIFIFFNVRPLNMLAETRIDGGRTFCIQCNFARDQINENNLNAAVATFKNIIRYLLAVLG